MPNKKQFYNTNKDKTSESKEKNTENKKIDVEFVSIFYHVTIKKIREKVVYRKYKSEFRFNNLLYTYLKIKSYRKKNNKSLIDKNLNLNKLSTKTLLRDLSILKDLKLIKFIALSSLSNKIAFRS